MDRWSLGVPAAVTMFSPSGTKNCGWPFLVLPTRHPCLSASRMISLSSFFADATVRQDDSPVGRTERSASALVEEAIEQRRRLGLRAGHQMAVEVERDLDRGMAHEDREGFGVDASRTHERRIGMAGLV